MTEREKSYCMLHNNLLNTVFIGKHIHKRLATAQ